MKKIKIKKSYIYYLVIIILLIQILFLGNSSFFQKYRIGKKLENLEDNIKKIKQENSRLQLENEKLKNDVATWEKMAREQGMQMKGDEIFRFKKRKNKK